MSDIVLQGADNVRELGGLPAASGVTRSGVLLRSDSLDRLTDADVADLVDARGLAQIIDLRSKSERAERGRGLLEHRAVRYDALDVIGDADLARRHEVRQAAFAAGTDPSVFTSDGYLELLDLGSHAFVTAFELMVAPGGTPALVHCSLGKDRTGVLVALLLDVAGVKRDAIVADYAATTRAMEGLQRRWETSAAFKEAMTHLPAFTFEAKEQTMELFLAGLDAQWGGGAEYFTAHGVPAESLDVWRQTVLDR